MKDTTSTTKLFRRSRIRRSLVTYTELDGTCYRPENLYRMLEESMNKTINIYEVSVNMC